MAQVDIPLLLTKSTSLSAEQIKSIEKPCDLNELVNSRDSFKS